MSILSLNQFPLYKIIILLLKAQRIQFHKFQLIIDSTQVALINMLLEIIL